MSAHKGSYRWYLQRLAEIWRPRGIFDAYSKRYHIRDWHKPFLRSMIRDTRKLLDELEAKLDG